MAFTYSALGATYGEHVARTYGTLFTPDEAPTTGLVALLARVSDVEVSARITGSVALARITTTELGAQIN